MTVTIVSKRKSHRVQDVVSHLLCLFILLLLLNCMKSYSLLVVFVLLAMGFSWQNKYVLPGGVFPVPVNDYVIMVTTGYHVKEQHVDSVRQEVEKYLGKKLTMYNPESALGQVVRICICCEMQVNGMMLYVKVRTGEEEAIFLKMSVIFLMFIISLNRLGSINLVSMKTNITASEPLTYFSLVFS